MKAPNTIQGTRKGFHKNNNLEAWIRRMRVHLKIKKKEYEDIMCYNNALDETRRSTHSIHKVQKKKDVYIALWHFPPFLLKEFGSSIPRMIPIQKAKDAKLTFVGGKNGCNALSSFEQILLTLFFCQAHFNFNTIGTVFGVKSRETVRKHIDRWMPVLI